MKTKTTLHMLVVACLAASGCALISSRPPVLTDCIPPEIVLRPGMTIAEVSQALGRPECSLGILTTSFESDPNRTNSLFAVERHTWVINVVRVGTTRNIHFLDACFKARMPDYWHSGTDDVFVAISPIEPYRLYWANPAVRTVPDPETKKGDSNKSSEATR